MTSAMLSVILVPSADSNLNGSRTARRRQLRPCSVWLALLLASACETLVAFGQPVPSPKRMAQSVSMSGVIVDPNGRALADVEVYSGRATRWETAPQGKARYEILRTGREGRFSLRTDAPFIVFRKAGFESQRVRCVKSVDKVVIKLVPASRPLLACPVNADCASLPRSSFCFPRVAGVSVGRPYSNTDSMSRDFSPHRNRHERLTHDCCGYVSSDGFPLLGDVWESTEYRETVYSVNGVEILDARGISSSGRIWRFLGMAGEYAAYNGYYALDPKDAALLDRTLDGVCIRNPVR
jgi:hypothetical protein